MLLNQIILGNLGKQLNQLVYPKNSLVQSNAVKDKKRLKCILKTAAQTYSNLADSLLEKNFVHQYYKMIKLKDKFDLTLTSEKKVLEICNLLTS